MLSFSCDYNAGAHKAILKRLVETNLESCEGYGNDPYTQSAREKIRKACQAPDAEIYFLVGGTQTNATVIAGMLRGYEGVVAAATGHVNVHEAGAIECTGHKVLTLPQHQGKIDAGELRDYLSSFFGDENFEHMVFPGMVYISHPTEYGTLYTAKELLSISSVCRKYQLPLYVDGARLGYGLAAYDTDVDLKVLCQCCDVFYIGGTKVGAFCGEAVVFPKGNAPVHFLTTIKQHGALLAKGRFLGIQFDTLFTNGLYLEISRHAVDMAMKLKNLFLKKGYRLYVDSPTNQQFVILKNHTMERLKKNCCFSFWESLGNSSCVVRFATSWATTEKDIKKLEELL
jgi:threonine aldolase